MTMTTEKERSIWDACYLDSTPTTPKSDTTWMDYSSDCLLDCCNAILTKLQRLGATGIKLMKKKEGEVCPDDVESCINLLKEFAQNHEINLDDDAYNPWFYMHKPSMNSHSESKIPTIGIANKTTEKFTKDYTRFSKIWDMCVILRENMWYHDVVFKLLDEDLYIFNELEPKIRVEFGKILAYITYVDHFVTWNLQNLAQELSLKILDIEYFYRLQCLNEEEHFRSYLLVFQKFFHSPEARSMFFQHVSEYSNMNARVEWVNEFTAPEQPILSEPWRTTCSKGFRWSHQSPSSQSFVTTQIYKLSKTSM